MVTICNGDFEQALPLQHCHTDISRCKSGAMCRNSCLKLEDVKADSDTDFPSSTWKCHEGYILRGVSCAGRLERGKVSIVRRKRIY